MGARWQRPGRKGQSPRLIVVHCTVSREMGTGAEAVASYFETTDRPGSAHVVCDNNSTVRCVEDEDTAYGAAGANLDGLHLELVGMPDQTSQQWQDPYSLAELFEAGLSVRKWSAKFAIPLRWLTVAEVADKTTKGLCTHADVEAAFPSTGHWDPGPNFPKIEALRIWTPNTPTLPQEDDMPKVYEIDGGPAAHPDGGSPWLVTGNVRWWIPNPSYHSALANVFGVTLISPAAWDCLKATTVLNIDKLIADADDLSALSDEDVARISKAVNDEQARRQAG